MAKLQHYVPQFYLQHWCDPEGKFWIYPVDGRPPYRGICKNYAAETHLYRTTTDDPSVNPDQEGWFSSWEGLWATRWPVIFDEAEDSRTRRNISRFLGTMAARHPCERNGVRDMNKVFLQGVSDLADHEEVKLVLKNETMPLKVSDIREQAKTDKDSVTNNFVRMLPALSDSIAKCLFKRKWGVVFSDHHSFITNDNPLFISRALCKKERFGFATPGTAVNFPISQKRFLVICDQWETPFSHYKLADEEVFIKRVVNAAERFVFTRHPNNLISDAIADRVLRLERSQREALKRQ